MNFNRHQGIAPVVLAIAVIVMIAAAGAVAYVVISSGKSTTSPSTTTTTPTTTTKTSSSSLSSSTASSKTSTSTVSSSTYTTASGSGTSSTTAPTTTSSTTTVVTPTTVSTFSCTTTYTTSTTTDYTPQFIDLIQQFSAMEFKVSGVINGTQMNDTVSYVVTSASGGIYGVNITLTSTEINFTSSFVVDSNNATVLSAEYFGQTMYGIEAKSDFDGQMALFGLEETWGGSLNVYTSSTYFHSTGAPTSMTFGTTTFPVTTYVANQLPLSVNACGITTTLTAFTLQVGTPPGTFFKFITYLHGVVTSPIAEDFTFQLVSMTEG